MSNYKTIGILITPKSDFKKAPNNWKVNQQDIN
jgi:hypothetical protein